MGTHPIFESDFDCLTDSGALVTVRLSGRRPYLTKVFHWRLNQHFKKWKEN